MGLQTQGVAMINANYTPSVGTNILDTADGQKYLDHGILASTQMKFGAASVLRDILQQRAFGTAQPPLFSVGTKNNLSEVIKSTSSNVGSQVELQGASYKRHQSEIEHHGLPAVKKANIGPDSLVSVDETPKIIAWRPHPISGRDDYFYQNEFTRLYNQLEALVQQHFGRAVPTEFEVDKDNDRPRPPNLSKEFLHYGGLVAEPDVHSGGWNRLLYDPRQRKWLVMGIIARVLDGKIFSELLFGASEQQTEMLKAMETTMVFDEGYARTKLRAHTVSTLLGGCAVTTNFDQDVTAITGQLLQILQPLATYLLEMEAKHSSAFGSTSTGSLYQDLCDIVSRAAYLSLCIRLDTSIFAFHYEIPGTRFEPKEQNCADLLCFQNSKENAIRARSRTARVATDRYGALTQIAVWPSITRFKPGNGIKGGESKGFRTVKICKAEVVSYWGSNDAKARKSMRLEHWLEEQEGIYN